MLASNRQVVGVLYLPDRYVRDHGCDFHHTGFVDQSKCIVRGPPQSEQAVRRESLIRNVNFGAQLHVSFLKRPSAYTDCVCNYSPLVVPIHKLGWALATNTSMHNHEGTYAPIQYELCDAM